MSEPKLLEAKHHVPDEPRAQALALIERGYTYAHTGEIVGVHESTAWRWHQRSKQAQEKNKPVMDRWVRSTLQAQDLLVDAMDLIEADQTKQLALKHVRDLYCIAGVGSDKLLKDTQPVSIQAQNVIYVFNAAQPPEVVEGELVNGESDAKD